MKPRPSLVILVIFALLTCGSVFVHGQGTDLGTIRGTVTDSSGAVVANAGVIVLDVGTGATRETKTNSRGESPTNIATSFFSRCLTRVAAFIARMSRQHKQTRRRDGQLT